MKMERAFRIETERISNKILETGEFPLTLFTNGEAADGHIIDIRGLEVADHIPMFRNHDADPTRRMGGLHDPHKPGKKNTLGGASLKMLGKIDMKGDGEEPDKRRDVAQGISVGDITGMSGRWEEIEYSPRSGLSKDHYAYSEVSGGWGTPMFFAKAKVLEGSIVGVPSDSAALIGRSRDLSKPEHVRRMYHTLVHGDPVSRSDAISALSLTSDEIRGLYTDLRPFEQDGLDEEEFPETETVDEPDPGQRETVKVDDTGLRELASIAGAGLSEAAKARLERLVEQDEREGRAGLKSRVDRLAFRTLGRV